jgi:crossover junction endodeoxyribonuclease RusA
VIVIRVAGIPAPQGSKRHVGNGVMVESSKAVRPWRDAVRTETQKFMTWADGIRGPLPGPVRVHVLFYLPRPAGHYRTGRVSGLRPSAPALPHRKPDIDKLARSTLDGLKEGGAYGDDAQVTTLTAQKFYADGMAPGAIIYITDLTEQEAGNEDPQ